MALNTPILTNLIAKIKTTLGSVDTVKEVYGYRLAGNPDKYPAVVFYPASFRNDFMSVQDNFRIQRFNLILLMSMESYTMQEVEEEIMPNAVDEIIEQFDEDWDMGTIDGHRVQALINTGTFNVQEEEQWKIAWTEMELLIRLGTNN